MRMSGGRAAVEALRAAGVTKIFGLMGSSALDMYDALYDAKDITHIGVRDERAGTHMADAFARVSGQVGVMVAGQSGPGATNLVTGLAQAQLAYSPVVAIACLPMTAHLGKDSFQEIDQHTLFSAITKRCFTVPTTDRIADLVLQAISIANSGRKGPVVLNIARDIFSSEIDLDIANHWRPITKAGGVPTEQLAAVKKLLLDAKSPAIIAGAGVKWERGHAELIRLSERLALPITASSGHGDVVPNDHPLYFGYVGPAPYGNPVARELIQGADVILAVGTRLAFNTTLFGHEVIPRTAKIIQIDIDAESIGRYYPAEVGVVGDAAGFCAFLADYLKGTQPAGFRWVERNKRFQAAFQQLWKERDELAAQRGTPLSPQQVFGDLRKVIPRDTIITLDSGTLCRQAADQLRYFHPPALLTPLDFGLVGFGYAAGLGAKVAAPSRPVVSVSGDGGFGMTVIEICTAVQAGINTIGIVLDNESWGSEKAYQRDFYSGRYIAESIINPRYDVVAESCGAKGYFVSAPGELADAVAKGLRASQPVVIHVKVDPEATVSSRKDALKHRRKL